MSDSCRCFDVRARVVMNEPKLSGKLDFSGEIITCSDGEDYKRGYEEGHAQGLIEGQADGYKKGYDEGHKVGSESGYSQGKQEGLTEGYDNGYEKGKSDGYKDGYDEGYSKGYSEGYEQGKAEGGEFIGVKYSDFTAQYNLPKKADARSMALIPQNSDAYIRNNRDMIAHSLFNNANKSTGSGFNTELEEIYMPDGLTNLSHTFVNCRCLKLIVGDLTSVKTIDVAFDGCESLTELPYMPNLENFSDYAVRGCKGLTSITFYKVLTTWKSNALTGCTNIETINLVDGWNTSIYAQHCPKLTSECVDNMISCLADMTGQNAPTIQFHADVKAKLSNEQIATITGKNWTLA